MNTEIHDSHVIAHLLRAKRIAGLTLAIKERESDWDIYANKRDYLFAICKENNPNRDSHFGDKYHIKKLMNFYLESNKRGGKHDPFDFCNLTERGREVLSGLYSEIDGRYISFAHRQKIGR